MSLAARAQPSITVSRKPPNVFLTASSVFFPPFGFTTSQRSPPSKYGLQSGRKLDCPRPTTLRCALSASHKKHSHTEFRNTALKEFVSAFSPPRRQSPIASDTETRLGSTLRLKPSGNAGASAERVRMKSGEPPKCVAWRMYAPLSGVAFVTRQKPRNLAASVRQRL